MYCMSKNTKYVFFLQVFCYICWQDCGVFSQSDVSTNFMRQQRWR
jgi:hypothetical protein